MKEAPRSDRRAASVSIVCVNGAQMTTLRPSFTIDLAISSARNIRGEMASSRIRAAIALRDSSPSPTCPQVVELWREVRGIVRHWSTAQNVAAYSQRGDKQRSGSGLAVFPCLYLVTLVEYEVYSPASHEFANLIGRSG